MKFEHTEVFNFEGALRGMRNPLESWKKSCSGYRNDLTGKQVYWISEPDINLAQRLIKGGSEHRKFLRQIMVSVDITAPLFWWKEFDTYKIGTVANSTSTMHKIMSKPFTFEMFEMDDFNNDIEEENFQKILDICNDYRKAYLEFKDCKDEGIQFLTKTYWKALIRILPESFLQTRTITMNYEVIRNIVHQRKGHKLLEWKSFIDWAKTLPYAEEFIFYEN